MLEKWERCGKGESHHFLIEGEEDQTDQSDWTDRIEENYCAENAARGKATLRDWAALHEKKTTSDNRGCFVMFYALQEGT